MNSGERREGMPPEFIIIGAMKCATSTLYEQLENQCSIFMVAPKEPNFFSDDDVYDRGISWYRSLYERTTDKSLLRGEASTHYTKLPTYTCTVARLSAHLSPDIKLIYVVRHPIERIVSHYIHEWTRNNIKEEINAAIKMYPELIDYGRYYYQLKPYSEVFNKIAVLNYHYLIARPQKALNAIGEYLGCDEPLKWVDRHSQVNSSASRLRDSWIRDSIVYSLPVSWIRHNIVAPSFRDRVKRYWQIRNTPKINTENYRELTNIFNNDLREFSDLIGCQGLNCGGFSSAFDFSRVVKV